MAGTSYGFVTPLVKLAQRHVSVASLTWGQYMFPMLLFALLAAYRRRPARVAPAAQVRILGSGIAAGATSIFLYLALKWLPATLAVILLFQFTWIVTIITLITQKKPPPAGTTLALAAILIGTLLATGYLTFGGIAPLSIPIAGVGAGLLAAVAYASLIVLNGSPVIAPVPAAYRTMVATIAAAVSVFLVYLWAAPTELWPSVPRGWLWVSWVGLFSQAIPYWLLTRSVSTIGATLSGILASVELPVAILFSHVLLQEPVIASQWLGVGLILLGILWAQAKDVGAPNPPPP